MATACGGDPTDGATLLGHCSSPASEVREFALEREWTVGGAADDALELTYLSRSTPAPDSGLSFVQRERAPVTTLNADGTLRHRVGRAGSGPGEWSAMSPPRMRWLADTLTVVDRARVHRFRERPGGEVEHLETKRIEPPFDQPLVPFHVLRDGSLLGTLPPRVQDGGRRLVHWREGEPEPDSVAVQLGDVSFRLDLPGGRFSSVRNPIPRHPLWDVAPDGRSMVLVDPARTLALDSGAYRIRKRSDDRETLWEREICYQPRAIPATERDDTIRAQASRLAEHRPGVPSGEMESRIRDALELPETWPPVTAVTVTSDGHTWIRREERPSATPWEIWDEAGELVGFVRLPSAARVLAVDGDAVWLAQADEWEVPLISRHRMVAE